MRSGLIQILIGLFNQSSDILNWTTLNANCQCMPPKFYWNESSCSQTDRTKSSSVFRQKISSKVFLRPSQWWNGKCLLSQFLTLSQLKTKILCYWCWKIIQSKYFSMQILEGWQPRRAETPANGIIDNVWSFKNSHPTKSGSTLEVEFLFHTRTCFIFKFHNYFCNKTFRF